MIPKGCKRLAEVDFPIAVVSRHAVREKSIRHGHPSTLHLWWARRPLAACRAMLLALLWPDPCDPLCPEEFKHRARDLLPPIQGQIGPTDQDLRKALLRFIGDFANWDLSANANYLEASRELVKAAYDGEPPFVVDPFAGGGSIPLEALRVGCDAFASDLNPVACLVLKVLLEDIPRYAPELLEEVRRMGAEIKREAEKKLAKFYPHDPDGAMPIAYLWARTVRCESPSCGAEIPLVRSFWLCKNTNRRRALRYKVAYSSRQKGDNAEPPQLEFDIFEPESEAEVPHGTIRRARATCPACGAVLPPQRVQAQLAAQRGGADVTFDEQGNRIGGARLLAVVSIRPDEPGRHYRLPTDHDYKAVWRAQKQLRAILDEWEHGGKKDVCPVPDEPTPTRDAHRAVGSQIPLYGMVTFGDLFTARQKATLIEVSSQVRSRNQDRASDTIACILSKLADKQSALCGWKSTAEYMGTHTFSLKALPMVW
ncbi:MAG: DUF1156 domain-containing protein, partial [Bacillota bacterium]